MNLDNSLIVIESQNKKYLTVIKSDDYFITNDGKISYNDIKSVPQLLFHLQETSSIFIHQPIKNLFY